MGLGTGVGGMGTYWDVEEHVDLLVEVLEPAGVVREFVIAVGGGCVSEEDALDLVGEIRCELGVIAHYIAVAGIRHQDEFPLGVGGENLLEQEFPDAQGCADVAKVQRTGVKRTAGIRLVDEVHVIPRDLLRGGRQVVEVDTRDRPRPVGIDIWHVLPLGKRAGERVQEAFFRLVDFGHTENIINVRDNRNACRWN